MADAGAVPGKSRGKNRKKSKSKGENRKNEKLGRGKEGESNVDDKNSRPWADLPEDLVDIVSKKFSMIDFLMFGRVCESWRGFFSKYKHKFMASQSPLVFEIPMYDDNKSLPLNWYCKEKQIEIASKNSARSARFYGINSSITFKIKLPNFYLQRCLGISSGYLILKRRSFLVINPITGHQIELPGIPYPHDRDSLNSAIFASVGSRQDYLLVALPIRRDRVFVFRDKKWRNFSYSHKPWFIEDMIVCDGSIFFVTNRFNIGVLDLKTKDFKLLELKYSPNFHLHARYSFVASKELLVIANHIYPIVTEIYRIDYSKGKWIKVENLGDEALFIDDKSAHLINPTEWGGRRNCVYCLPSDSDNLFVYSLDGDFHEYITLKKGWFSSQMLLWYFPHHSWSTEH